MSPLTRLRAMDDLLERKSVRGAGENSRADPPMLKSVPRRSEILK